jgi:hypothetical protein
MVFSAIVALMFCFSDLLSVLHHAIDHRIVIILFYFIILFILQLHKVDVKVDYRINEEDGI